MKILVVICLILMFPISVMAYEIEKIQDNVYIITLDINKEVKSTIEALKEIGKTKWITNTTSVNSVGNNMNEGSRTRVIIVYTKDYR